ncbi:hypothetical protein KQX54_021414 [Cotesia glomerata]|uniref:Uncharacterized protein n=1 Tax=Cotesia glomerata TaxID=32391 RepID=A0AAV7J8K6_COTGL|nr:hypothetical protein KQX54_021414 [Cotesia glomerata]
MLLHIMEELLNKWGAGFGKCNCDARPRFLRVDVWIKYGVDGVNLGPLEAGTLVTSAEPRAEIRLAKTD